MSLNIYLKLMHGLLAYHITSGFNALTNNNFQKGHLKVSIFGKTLIKKKFLAGLRIHLTGPLDVK